MLLFYIFLNQNLKLLNFSLQNLYLMLQIIVHFNMNIKRRGLIHTISILFLNYLMNSFITLSSEELPYLLGNCFLTSLFLMFFIASSTKKLSTLPANFTVNWMYCYIAVSTYLISIS